jgi:hypothetical protein
MECDSDFQHSGRHPGANSTLANLANILFTIYIVMGDF